MFFVCRGRDRSSSKAVININYGEEVVEEQNVEQESKGEEEEQDNNIEFYDEAHLAIAVCDTAIGTVRCLIFVVASGSLLFFRLNECLS
jgi:hypothetical protein